MSTTSVTPDPWAVVSHTPIQQTQAGDPWAVVAHQPATQPTKQGITAADILQPIFHVITGGNKEAAASAAHITQRGMQLAGLPTSMAEAEANQKREKALPLWQRLVPGRAPGESSTPTQAVASFLGGPGVATVSRMLGTNTAAIPELTQKSSEESKQIIPAVRKGLYKQALAHTVGSAGYAANALTAPVLGSGPTNAGEAFGRGDTEEGLAQSGAAIAPFVGGDLIPGFKGKAARATTLPTHVEALTGLISDEGGRVNPFDTASTALPEARTAAIKANIDPATFVGRKGGEAVVGKNGVFTQAIREHRAQFAEIKKPFATAQADATPIGQAYLDAITPEMRAHEPQIANRLTAEARKYVDVADDGTINGSKPMTIDELDAFRTRLNRELNTFEGKSTGEQIMSDVEVRAHKSAADAARNTLYDSLDRLSGNEPGTVRTLKAKEGALIEAKNSLEKEFNKASGEQGEAVTKSIREKLASPYPSRRGVEHGIIREVVGPKPIAIFNQRLQRMFADLPKAEAPAPVVNANTSAHVAQENAFYTQARSELGANASPSTVLQRAQQLKQQAKVATPKVTPPYAPSAGLTAAQKATAWMLAAKSGNVSPDEADRQAHRQVGKGTKVKMLRPVGGE